MVRTGRVVELKKNHPMVCFDRLEACESCGQCLDKNKQTLVRVLGEAQIGDIVEVELPDKKVLALSVIMYILPLLGLIIGLYLGNRFLAEEGLAFLTGLAGLAVCFIGVKLFDNWLQNQRNWQPHIVKVHSSEEL
jgi:sigma-E factor negative regulatory protein RseC